MSTHFANGDGLLHSGIAVITSSQPKAFLVIQLALGAYFLWWIWRFQLSPRWNPSEPEQLPYWIPCHAPAFFKDSQALLTRGRTYFGNTREPFSINIAGTKIYIITSPQDMSLVYKNTSSLSFDEFIHDLHLAFGMSLDGRHAMWDKSHGKCLIHQANDLHHAQLQPGQHLDDLTDTFVAQIRQRIAWSRMVQDHAVAGSGSSEQISLSLYDWCAQVLIPAASVAFFGEALLRVNDGRIIGDFLAFDQDSWMLTYRYPHFLARKMYAGKDRNTATFTRYFQLPSEDRSDACYYVKALEARQREAGMQARDIAISNQLFYWVTNANAFKITFWLLTYLLHRPNLLEAIRQETLPTAWQETLRLTSGASSARTVLSPTWLRSGCCLQRDAKLLIPYRQAHFDAAVFGGGGGDGPHHHDVATFHPERFLDAAADVGHHPAFKPFGGGVTYCSGRFIAKREVFAFVALVLGNYEIRLEEGVSRKAALPRLDESTPTLGVMGPVKGDTTRVVVRRRGS